MIQSSGYFSPLLFIYIFRPSSSVSIRWLKVKMVWVTLCRKVKGLSRPSQIPNLCEELSKEPLQSGASPPLLPPPLPPSPAAPPPEDRYVTLHGYTGALAHQTSVWLRDKKKKNHVAMGTVALPTSLPSPHMLTLNRTICVGILPPPSLPPLSPNKKYKVAVVDRF